MFVAISADMNVLRLCILLPAIGLCISAADADISEQQVTSPPLIKAMESLKANKYSEALTILTEMKPDNATLAQYYFVFGRLDNAMKKPLVAVEHFRKAYLYAPRGDMKEIALIERAETYLGMRYFYEAKSVYTVFLKEFHHSRFLGRVYPGVARSLAETGSLREALTYYEKAGNSPDVLIGRANTLHRLGHYREADKIYTSLIETNEASLRATEESLYYLGENLRQVGKLLEASKYLSEVKGLSFKGRADLSLGLIALQQDRKEEAAKTLSGVLEAGDREIKKQALLALSDVELKQGRTEEAKKRLEDLKLRHPYGKTYDEALLRLARIYGKEGSPEKAVTLLSELALKSALKKEALAELEGMIVQARNSDKEQLLRIWKTAGPLLFDTSREKLLLDLTDEFKNSGGPYIEIAQYLAKHGTEGAKMKGLAFLAGHYTEKGESGKAGEYLKRLKTMKGSGDEIIRLEARLASLQKDHKAAADKFLQLKKIQTGDLMAFGDAVAARPDLLKAVERYEKAVKETDGNAAAYTRLADIMYASGKRRTALAYYRIALEKEPNQDWALYRVGTLTEGTEAEEMLRKVSRQDPVIAKLTEVRLRELDLSKKGTDGL